MMILWCGFFLVLHFLCHVHPRECNVEFEYKYKKDYVKCCKKCAPGERMDTRCNEDSETTCKQCSPDFYMDEYSMEMECKRCSQCTKEHMVYKVNCSNSSDAICGCESGYKCSSNACTDCEKIPTTTTSAVTQAPIVSQNTVWITLSLCCLCILLTCFILISRTTPACGWIMLASAGCCRRTEKTSIESSQCTEDENVPMPVQEVCEHKMWQEEV